MKLLKLHINSNYGSIIKGFKFQFRAPYNERASEIMDWVEFHPFCFAGLNGSGKSNVLEAIANIFYHIECCSNVNQPKNFQEFFQPEICKPDAFELDYYICKEEKYSIENLIKVSISKKEKNETEGEYGFPKMTYQPFPFKEEPIPVSVVAEKYAKSPAPAKRYLPDLIIGYSSGENEILSIPFLKTRLLHFDEYRIALEEKAIYEEPESSLLYVDYEMSQAVLLANFIFQEEKVLKPLHVELGIADIVRFRMNINLHKYEDKLIIEQYRNVIDAFKRCATTAYEEKNERLVLDFWINSASRDAFKKNFPKGIFQLFQAFQILYTLNYHGIEEEIKSEVYQSKGYYTDGKIPKPKPAETVFHFLDYYIKKSFPDSNKEVYLLMKNLSDGEQQFLHTMGICLMLENKSALLLLDEPETHFNPDWRSKFISTLKESLDQSQSNNLMHDILITSHSPFIISDCYPDKVVVFENGKSPINAKELDIPTFGTSVNILTNKIFGSKKTISGFSYEKLNDYRKRFEEGESYEKIQIEINEKFGDSIEKLLLLKELSDKSKK